MSERDGPLSFEEGDEGRAQSGERPVPPPARPRGSSSWLFGVVVVVLLAYITLNTLRNTGAVSRGIEAGTRLPPFAAPLALSRLDGDANVSTTADQGQRGKLPACQVRGPQVLNSCRLVAGAPSVLAFVATAEPRCARQLDGLERVRARYAGVRFAAVAARTNRGKLRELIRRRGWRFPVGYDRDGAVFANYGIVDCPTVTFSYPGGIAMRTTSKPLSDSQLSGAVARLVTASRSRGWAPPA